MAFGWVGVVDSDGEAFTSLLSHHPVLPPQSLLFEKSLCGFTVGITPLERRLSTPRNPEGSPEPALPMFPNAVWCDASDSQVIHKKSFSSPTLSNMNTILLSLRNASMGRR